MPPAAIKNVQDLIYWQYAKIISASAGSGKKNYGFIMDRFKALRSGKIEWSGSIREFVHEKELPDECIYCGSRHDLSTDHLIPKSRNGPDIGDNAVRACRKCNSSKGDRGVYEWFKLDRKDKVPRIAEGKYLKLLFKMHNENGTLDAGRKDIERLCNDCEQGYLCTQGRKLTVYCLESVLMRNR